MLHGLSCCGYTVPSYGPSTALSLGKQIISIKAKPNFKTRPTLTLQRCPDSPGEAPSWLWDTAHVTEDLRLCLFTFLVVLH